MTNYKVALWHATRSWTVFRNIVAVLTSREHLCLPNHGSINSVHSPRVGLYRTRITHEVPVRGYPSRVHLCSSVESHLICLIRVCMTCARVFVRVRVRAYEYVCMCVFECMCVYVCICVTMTLLRVRLCMYALAGVLVYLQLFMLRTVRLPPKIIQPPIIDHRQTA